MGRPSVTVGFPWFVFPFDSTQANFGGGFADVLEILARCVGGEVGATGTWVGVEPFSHFGLVFFGGMLVAEYVGDFAFFAVVWAWYRSGAVLRRATWDPEGVPEESVFVRDGAGGSCERCAPSKVGAFGDR